MSLRVMTQGGGAGGEFASIFVTGLSEANAVSATKDGKTVNGKWVAKPNPAWVGLPDGYTQLEYIESTGTQYINTGVNPDYTTGYSIDFQLPSIITTDLTIMGSLNPNIVIAGGNSRFDYGYKSGTGTTDTFGASDTERHTFMLNYMCSMQASLDDETKQLPAANITNNYPAYIFATNNSGSVYGQIPAKVFGAKITKGNDILRDFIPAKRNSDGVFGMYDLVNNVFYTNAGTGTFIAGAEVPQYIYGHEISKIKSYGMWTVTATNGEDAKQQDVLVDAAIEFEIELSYSA